MMLADAEDVEPNLVGERDQLEQVLHGASGPPVVRDVGPSVAETHHSDLHVMTMPVFGPVAASSDTRVRMSAAAGTDPPLPAIALDLDGVIWRGRRPIPGSAEAVACLRQAGHRVGYVSNNSTVPPGAVVERLQRAGIPAHEGEVITSAQAAARQMQSLLWDGAVVLVVGGEGIGEALADERLSPVGSHSGRRVDGVVAGLDTSFDYAALDAALQALRGGAKFVATNTDPTLPVEDGVRPGSGAIIAAISTASGVQPIVAGKPHEPIAALVRDQLGSDGIVVGDRPDTDGRLAARLGWPFGLVLSGVTSEVRQSGADVVADDLAALTPKILAKARVGGADGPGC
jgi:glycerol 3-phosphatase-2